MTYWSYTAECNQERDENDDAGKDFARDSKPLENTFELVHQARNDTFQPSHL